MCPDCEARRQLARKAVEDRNIADAVAEAAKGAAEILGLKPKTGAAELAEKVSPEALPPPTTSK